MTTLYGQETIEYLKHLKSEAKKRASRENEESLEYLAYSQMHDLIGSEIKFLKYINSNGKTEPQLALSLNGLPSVASLSADLEKMCEIAEQEPMFAETAERFKKGQKEKKDLERYKKVSLGDWQDILEENANEKLITKTNFQINEDSDSKFQINIGEEIYVQGHDQYSQKFPIAIRNVKSTYMVMWNRLIDNLEKEFYIVDIAPPIGKQANEQSNQIKVLKKTIEKITKSYEFDRKNYPGAKIPLIKSKLWLPKNYSTFLRASWGTRTYATNKILDILNSVFGKIEIISNTSRKIENDVELEAFLGFEKILFENAPEDCLTKSDLKAFNTELELKQACSGLEIGKITYHLPYKEEHKIHPILFDKQEFSRGYKINLEKIKLEIFENTIEKKSQSLALKQALDRIKI